MRQENVGKPAQISKTRKDIDKRSSEHDACVIKSALCKRSHKIIGKTRAESGESKTGNVLIATKRYREKGIYKTAERGKQHCKEHGKQEHRYPRGIGDVVHIGNKHFLRDFIAGYRHSYGCGYRVGQTFKIQFYAEAAAESTHAHDAGHTQIEMSCLFVKSFAKAAEQKHDSYSYCGNNTRYHYLLPPLSR